MQEYVVGFAFYGSKILLIEKTKPEWQKGKLNGVGGKIELGETPLHAMIREFDEECGLKTTKDSWALYHKEVFPHAKVYFFVTQEFVPVHEARQLTAESLHIVNWFDVINEKHNTIYNLPYLVLMARTFSFGLHELPLITLDAATE